MIAILRIIMIGVRSSFTMYPDSKNPTLCVGAIQVNPATNEHIWVQVQLN